MTEEEINHLLHDAIELWINTDRSIILCFPNKHESEKSYEAVTEFFGKSEVTLDIKKSIETLKLFITDKNGQSVHRDEIEYNEENFNTNLVNGDIGFRIKLFMVHKHYHINIPDGMPIQRAIIKQQINKLNITDFNIIS